MSKKAKSTNEESNNLKKVLEEWFDNLNAEEKLKIVIHAYSNKNTESKGGFKMLGKIISLVFGFIIGIIVGTLFGKDIVEFIASKVIGG